MTVAPPRAPSPDPTSDYPAVGGMRRGGFAAAGRPVSRRTRERVDRLLAEHLARRARGETHPVEDFLHAYYSFSPGRLRRWHPGPGVVLAGAAGMPRASWRFYRDRRRRGGPRRRGVPRGAGRHGRLRAGPPHGDPRPARDRRLLRPPRVGHGLPAGTGAGAAYRAAPAARPRTAPTPSSTATRSGAATTTPSASSPARRGRATACSRPATVQVALEQPGCLHAGMDVYKWAYKLTPAIPSELVADAFELARDIRVLDMQLLALRRPRPRAGAGGGRDGRGEGGLHRRAAASSPPGPTPLRRRLSGTPPVDVRRTRRTHRRPERRQGSGWAGRPCISPVMTASRSVPRC